MGIQVCPTGIVIQPKMIPAFLVIQGGFWTKVMKLSTFATLCLFALCAQFPLVHEAQTLSDLCWAIKSSTNNFFCLK